MKDWTDEEHARAIDWLVGMTESGHRLEADDDGFMAIRNAYPFAPVCLRCFGSWSGHWHAGGSAPARYRRCDGARP